MQTFGGSLPVGRQQSLSSRQRSSRFAHIGTSDEHMPIASLNSLIVPSRILQKPQQQSIPGRAGVSVALTRIERGERTIAAGEELLPRK